MNEFAEQPRRITLREMRLREQAAKKTKEASPVSRELSDTDTEAIASLKTNERYARYLRETPDAVIGKHAEHVRKFLDQVAEEFAHDPQTEERCSRILIEHDSIALRENGERQRNAIAQYWQEQNGGDAKAKARLAAFVVFTQCLQPVRADKPGLPYTQFESPRRVGAAASFGAQDTAVQADRYVYGSFDGIRHNMARGNSYRLDEAAIADRAEIVMQDIANVIAREGAQPMKRYIDNLFDYRNGKQVLAYYLASVFESPKEAERFLERNNGMQQAQRWDEGFLSPVMDEVHVQEGDDDATVRARWQEAEMKSDRRKEEIERAMKDILAATGIEPPLSLEVRIPDTAPIVT